MPELKADDPRRNEFGDFLRARRERLSPGALGLPDRRRRRTPGLRREEVAERAGIGVDWYIRLEQGRTVSPPAATIDALARALELGSTEHAHLRLLARGGGRRAFVRETVPDAIRRLLEGLAQPAYVTGARWDLLATNAAAQALFEGFGGEDGDHNVLVFVLTNPVARQLFGRGWEAEAARMVAQFRSTYDLWAGDPSFEALVARLRIDSVPFSRWWDAHEVRRGGVTGRKTLVHSTLGTRTFEYTTFQANDDPALKLAIYTAV